MPLLGIIGCGTHALHHLANLRNNFTVWGIWDPNPKWAKQLQSKGSFYHCKTLEELLNNTDATSVMIASPEKYHLEQIELALKAGKHVFCEKPLLIPGQDISRLEEAFDLAEEKKLVLTSCHPRRFDRPITWLQQKLPTLMHDFGNIISIEFDFSYHKPSSQWKHNRSLLLDHLNHEVDLMNHLFDIHGFEAWKLNDGFDRYEVVGKRDDGVTFHFRGTRRLNAHIYPEWCRVRLSCGEVVLDMLMGLAYVINHEKKSTETISGLDIDYEGRLEKVTSSFLDSICKSGTGETGGYLTRSEMLMNTEAAIMLQNEGVQRINVRC